MFYEEESWYSFVNFSVSFCKMIFLIINGYIGGNLLDIEVCLDRNVCLYMMLFGG